MTRQSDVAVPSSVEGESRSQFEYIEVDGRWRREKSERLFRWAAQWQSLQKDW